MLGHGVVNSNGPFSVKCIPVVYNRVLGEGGGGGGGGQL